MYGKIMSIPDALIVRYFELATRVTMEEVSAIEAEMKGNTANPRDIKMRLAREIVSLYHGEKQAKNAEHTFVTVFQKKEMPDEIPEIKVQKKEWNIVDLLVESKLATSKTNARQLVEQGGVSIDERLVESHNESVVLPKDGAVIKKGKRHFVKIIL
ncbi:MAG: S4 domain-containing protein, partial [Candidatus Uhrbacteria bacterium]|nr:S4 domain-containing protein [Candidatus Uhrbacteria bacterium]